MNSYKLRAHGRFHVSRNIKENVLNWMDKIRDTTQTRFLTIFVPPILSSQAEFIVSHFHWGEKLGFMPLCLYSFSFNLIESATLSENRGMCALINVFKDKTRGESPQRRCEPRLSNWFLSPPIIVTHCKLHPIVPSFIREFRLFSARVCATSWARSRLQLNAMPKNWIRITRRAMKCFDCYWKHGKHVKSN